MQTQSQSPPSSPARPAPPASSTPTPWALASTYRTPGPGYDEFRATPDGPPRPHWHPLAENLAELGQAEFTRRWDRAQQLLRENGVTYNVYGDPEGMDRLWTFDALPFIIPEQEWDFLRRGLVQRARLLNSILADIYGPQRLLRSGLLPPAVVAANPAFLRPCVGAPVPGKIHLHLYAADLARSPDGTWWVFSNRTQAPSGLGYTLENRSVSIQTFPDVMRHCRVEKILPFYDSLRSMLDRLADTLPNRHSPGGHRYSGPPRGVLLTPGPYNETYFEHTYLARRLGLPIAQGADLTVRDRRVFLKTLEGLSPVDIILRRVDEDFCDPLELRPDSGLGVPGLVQAARGGHVLLANSLGSGLVETSTLLAFLPGLSRHLLGESLLLPSVATWWCGQPSPLAYVRDHFERLIIRPAFGSAASQRVSTLSAQEKSALLARIALRPFAHVAQEDVTLSTAPSWSGSALRGAWITLRVHLASTGDGNYTVLPGGLARLTHQPSVSGVSMQQGGSSKDTWILTSKGQIVQPIEITSPSADPATLRRAAPIVPARAADNLYWLGRQAERADSLLRTLRTLLTRLATESSISPVSPIPALARSLRSAGALPFPDPPPDNRPAFESFERSILSTLFTSTSPFAVRTLLESLHQIANTVRDRLTLDAWRVITQLQADLLHAAQTPPRTPGHALELLHPLLTALSALSGYCLENMTRTPAWLFLDSGRRLERALQLSQLLSAVFVPHDSERRPEIESVLEIADSRLTYLARYFNQFRVAPLLDLLITDPDNPRSLLFQIATLASHLERLPRLDENPLPSPHLRLALDLHTRLRLADPHHLAALGPELRRRDHLETFLHHLRESLCQLSDSLSSTHFSLTPLHRQ